MNFDLKSKYLLFESLDINKEYSCTSESESESETNEISKSVPTFIIDKTPAVNNNEEPQQLISSNENKPKRNDTLSSVLRVESKDKSYIIVTPGKTPKLVKEKWKQLSMPSKVDNLLEKSVITPGFEKLHSIPPYEETKGEQKRNWKKEKERTKGANWFNLPATELTEERKNDLTILQMRQSLDTKRFYKKNDRSSLPKYFQIGTIIESPADFYHARVPKKQRKRTIVEELLEDQEFRSKNKKKYKEAMKSKPKSFKQKNKKTNVKKLK